jgi:hypothetical protein
MLFEKISFGSIHSKVVKAPQQTYLMAVAVTLYTVNSDTKTLPHANASITIPILPFSLIP